MWGGLHDRWHSVLIAERRVMQGENVVSVGIEDPNSWAMMSGTSMATPHVVWRDITVPGSAHVRTQDVADVLA